MTTVSSRGRAIAATRGQVAPTALMRALPNWLTASRVIMALVFFGALAWWSWDGSQAKAGQIDWLLVGAAILFGVAVATDALDGYLARKWQVESAFGRIMDPFADKILVVGAFVFLAGPAFWVPTHQRHGVQLSGVTPWMVVVIMGRELLVTSIRGVLEGQGIKFASDWWGKGKMILQSVVVPLVLLAMAVLPVAPILGKGWMDQPVGRQLIDAVVWLMVVVTVVSGVPYVSRCIAILSQRRRELRAESGGE